MTLEDLAAIARNGVRVGLNGDSEGRIGSARKLIEKWVQEGRIIYGITTGFGALSELSAKDVFALDKLAFVTAQSCWTLRWGLEWAARL